MKDAKGNYINSGDKLKAVNYSDLLADVISVKDNIATIKINAGFNQKSFKLTEEDLIKSIWIRWKGEPMKSDILVEIAKKRKQCVADCEKGFVKELAKLKTLAKFKEGDPVEWGNKKGIVRSIHIFSGNYVSECCIDMRLLTTQYIGSLDTIGICYTIGKINNDGSMHATHNIDYSPIPEEKLKSE